jgi:hypothetical protein
LDQHKTLDELDKTLKKEVITVQLNLVQMVFGWLISFGVLTEASAFSSRSDTTVRKPATRLLVPRLLRSVLERAGFSAFGSQVFAPPPSTTSLARRGKDLMTRMLKPYGDPNVNELPRLFVCSDAREIEQRLQMVANRLSEQRGSVLLDVRAQSASAVDEMRQQLSQFGIGTDLSCKTEDELARVAGHLAAKQEEVSRAKRGRVFKCPICIEEKEDQGSFAPCGHIACSACIQEVMAQLGLADGAPLPPQFACPLCNKPCNSVAKRHCFM